MMQNTKVILYKWNTDIVQPDDYLDIDWPAIHKDCGLEHIRWINEQDDDKCQMTLELFDGGRQLIVEFFDKTIETTYHLMWAK